MAQHGAGDDDDGQLARVDPELAKDDVHVGITIGVEPFVRDAAPGQELPNPERLGREARADDADGRGCPGHQDGPPSHEGGEDDVAQAGPGGNEPPQVVPRHDQDLAGLDHTGGDEHPQPGQEVELAQKAPGARGGR